MAGQEDKVRKFRLGGLRGVQRWIIGVVLGLVLLLVGTLAWLDTSSGHRFIASRIGAMTPESGLRISVGGIDGSIYRQARLRNVQLSDSKGRFLTLPDVELDWFPFAWLYNRLDVDRLAIGTAYLHKLPELKPSTEPGPLLPDFDIRIMELRVDRLIVEEPVAGRRQQLTLKGDADIRSGRAVIDFNVRSLDGQDALILSLDSRPEDNRFDLSASINAPKDGVIAAIAGLTQDANLSVRGRGDWNLWNGRLVATLDGQSVAGVALRATRGEYVLDGTIEGSRIAGTGIVARLTEPRLTLKAKGTFEDRQLRGALKVESAALALDLAGGIDMKRGAYDNLGAALSLRKPGALMANASGEGLLAKLRLHGPTSTARFDYLVTGERVRFGSTVIEKLRAAGRGRLGGERPTLIPIDMAAGRVTGQGEVLDGILRNIALNGVLQFHQGIVTSNRMTLRSDKLDTQILVLADLNRGTYDVGLVGTLRNLLVPGLGIVDVRADMKAVPAANGGFGIRGQVDATMRRLDNGFLKGIAGGLPRLSTGVALGPDGRLVFDRMTIRAPLINLAANGYRATDGNFHFQGQGTHKQYGPLRLTLDGQIDRPEVRLLLARPLDAAGLQDVRLHLKPDSSGYIMDGRGGSLLGAFTLDGAILMPAQGDTVIDIRSLQVAQTTVRGQIVPGDDGMRGRLTVTGGGMNGSISLQPVNGVQQIVAQMDANGARFAGPPPFTVGRARMNATIMLNPEGANVDATIQARSVQRGSMRIGRLAVNAKMVGGTGKVTASLSGQRGRQFDLQLQAAIKPGSVTVSANGTVDRRPLRIVRGGVLTQTGDGWALAPTTISYAGGTAQLSGVLGGAATQVEARLRAIPLSVLDLASSELGLGGTATGSLSFNKPRGAVPTGNAEIRIRGLTRSGLAISSAPMDIGLNAVLNSERLALRAVIAADGKTVGRAQALITPLGRSQDLMERLSNAPLVAQLRYNGRADTLWRLSNVELIDVTGPIAVGADVRGTLADPQITGAMAADDLKMTSPVTGMALSQVQMRGEFSGSQLVLRSFRANAKGGGTVAGSGRFEFAAARGIGIDLRIDADQAMILDRDDIGATVTGPLHIVSTTGDGGVISGDVDMVKSRFTLGRAAAVAEIPQLKVIELNRRGDDFDNGAPTAPWRLDLRARARNQLAVTGMGLDSEWRTNLRIRGTIDNPAILGVASLVRGRYEFAGRSFELREGQIRFDGSTPANPTLNIEAEADLQDIEATIKITGTAEQPDIQFTSNPQLPQDELLSRLLFGSSITQLSAPEALQLAAAVGSLQGGGGGLDPINAVRKAAGLDRLRILPADPTRGQGTAISAGKYITRRTYVELITDGQGYSATQVEYQVTRWLSLLSGISSLGRASANVRVSRDY